MKILIIRFSSIGDILLTFPVLEGLRRKYPDAEIHILTKASFVGLFQLHPSNFKVIAFDQSLFGMASQLKKENYHMVIDLHNNLRTFLLQCFMLHFHWKRFHKLNLRKWLLTTFNYNVLPSIHITERYAKAADVIPVYPLILKVPDGISPFELPNQYVAWVLGATFQTKQFPIEKLKETIEKVEHPIVLLGGEQEIPLAQQILASFPACISLAGQTSIIEAAAILQSSKGVVTNDTGLMHLAAFFNKPMVCIWGNTVPSFGMYPYQCDHVYFSEVESLSCRPCSKIGYNACPKGHFNCMMKQDSNKIAAQVNGWFYSGSQ